MKRFNDSKITLLLVVLVLWPVQSPAKEYVLTVGNEQLRFVPQGEKGYVIKQARRTVGTGALAGTLFLEEGQVQPIGGLDRHGIWIVENNGPASRNNAVMAELVQNGAAEYAAPLFSSNGEMVAIIPEIVIRVHPGVDARQVHFLCESMALAIIKPMEFTTQEYLLQVLGQDADAVFTALEKLNNVEWIEWAAPNTASQPKLFGKAIPGDHDSGEQLRVASAGQDANSPGVIPNDEYFHRQWHLHNTGQSGGTPGADINAPEAWAITTGDPNIVVAVIDCGVDSNHPDLVNNLVSGYDFIENDDQPDPALDHWFNGHGTACAGLIAAQGNNGVGVSGVTWNCKLMPIRRGGRRANGSYYHTTVADTATAFRWAAAHGADIFSDSWSGYSSPQPIIQSAIVDVTMRGGLGRDGKGCVFLAAAGNNSGPLAYPEKYPEVVAVGATDHNDIRCSYSNYGPELDITAPGGGEVLTDFLALIWTTDIHGLAGISSYPENPCPDVLDYTVFNGTSAACPVAAGVAALILSVEPNLTGEEARHFLERSAKDLGAPGRDDYYGWGRVDARAALDMVLAKRADLNDDWKVDLRDFAVLAACWKTDDLRGDIGPVPRPDGAVDVQDLALMCEYWLKEIPELYSVWKLDETAGTIAHDSINNKDGNLNGNPIWQPDGGKINGALQLDGTDDYVSTPFVLDPNKGPFSVFAGVKGGASGQVILSQAGGANWLLADPATGALMTELKPAILGKSLSCQRVITDGDWHWVGVTKDVGNRILYVDGVEVARDTQDAVAPSDGGLHIGAGKNLETGTFWSGLIDDVRIYNRALTADEINQLMVLLALPFATKPSPSDGSPVPDVATYLTWTPGDGAVSHEGFLSSNFADVNDRKPSASQGEVTDPFYYVSGLVRGTTYYWCVDEKDASNNVYKGNIWSFTVMPLTAWDPSPTNGQALVTLAPTLYWTQGADAIASVVYFGTSSTAPTYKTVINHTLGQLRYNWPVTPTPLAYNTTYYWRIDQREPNSAILKGDVWSFTTVPNIPITDPTLLGWWKIDEGSGVTVLDWSGHNRHGTINGGATYATGVFDKALNLDGIDDWVSIGNRILYVDGVEVARDTQDAVAPSGGGLHIGAGKNLDAGTFWSDLIDDVRIHDRAVAP